PFTFPDIPVLVKNGLPPKLFYSLADAAKIANCDSKDLLHYAGLGKIRLHIPVPENCHLQVRDSLNGALGTNRDYDVELLSL
ncbi:hypothetical protein, partial [Borreliella garinii]|uniref:hypothetical protein n=1 Tax=Borreliella garinii TaxID=29519 RepID=UPI001AEF74A2